MDIFTIAVGFSTVRPIIPDQHTAFVIVAADNDIQAKQIAAQMVGQLSEMVTSTKIIGVEI